MSNPDQVFLGACMDTGATKTVIGLPQAKAYARLLGVNYAPEPTARKRFLFGGVAHPSLGTIRVNVPIAAEFYASLDVDIVDLDVPFLFGLDTLDELALYVNNVEDRLKCDRRGIRTPLTRKNKHIFLEWDEKAHYTTTELGRLHRHFAHPPADRLAAILRRAGDPNVEQGTRAQLTELTKQCDICQRLARQPGRFRVTLPPDDVVFNRTVLLDVMYLDRRPLLHIIDKDTLFSAACFLNGETVEAVWQAYLDSWVCRYIGHAEAMHIDAAPQFRSAAWQALAQSAGTRLINSGVESHNALGSGERYHEYLRNIYRRVRSEHGGLSQESALILACHAMNSTAGTNGLIPTLLVFGVIPRMPVAPLRLPVQRDRVQAMVTARAEMLANIARTRLRTALAAPVPAAADRDVHPGMEVLVYREPPANEWVGPYTVISQADKMVSLAVDGQAKLFSIDKVKEYLPPAPSQPVPPNVPTPPAVPNTTPVPPTEVETPPSPAPATAPTSSQPRLDDVADPVLAPPPWTLPTPANSETGSYGRQPPGAAAASPGLGEAFSATVDLHAPRLLSRPTVNIRGPRTRCCPAAPVIPSQHDVLITKVIPAGDPRLKTARFQEAAIKEVGGLRDRGTFQVVKLVDLPKGANIISGRFVYTLKQVGTPDEFPKARFVAQGHRDKAKDFVVHNLAVLRQRSTRMLVSTSAILNFRLYLHDITQAYLQSQEGFTRDLYLRPRAEDRHLFDLAEDEVLLLVLPLYGICDAGDYWHVTLTSHIEEDLGMVPLVSEPALYAKRDTNGKLLGLLGAYVDDCLMGGNRQFQQITELTLRRFEGKPRKLDGADFVGVEFATHAEPTPHFSLGQVAYIDNLNVLPTTASFSEFASARASAAWLAHTRPDLCCGLNQAAQVSEANFLPTDVKALNAVVGKAKSRRDLVLTYPRLDLASLRLHVYADASFATNKDQSSQIGYIILLCDASGRIHVLAFTSRKSKRVVRSIMAGEVYAFSAALDEAYITRYDLESLYEQHIPITVHTDSKQLFDVVTRGSHPTEKRLMIDVAAARQAYKRHDLAKVALVTSEHNVADGLTKPRTCTALDYMLKAGVDSTPLEQWVTRTGLCPPRPTTGPGAV